MLQKHTAVKSVAAHCQPPDQVPSTTHGCDCSSGARGPCLPQPHPAEARGPFPAGPLLRSDPPQLRLQSGASLCREVHGAPAALAVGEWGSPFPQPSLMQETKGPTKPDVHETRGRHPVPRTHLQAGLCRDGRDTWGPGQGLPSPLARLSTLSQGQATHPDCGTSSSL